MQSKLLYVSGKYTDPRGAYFVHANIEEARRVSAILWALGIPNICPHANSYHLDGIVHYDEFLRGDLLMIERCDAIVVLPSYLTSKGSQKEMLHNREINHPTFMWPKQIPDIVDYALPDGVMRAALDMAIQLSRGEEERASLNRCSIK